MHEVLVNRLEDLSLPTKSVAKLTDRPDMTLDVYRGGKTTIQQQQSKPFDPTALRMAKTLWSFGHSECNRVKCSKHLFSH